MREIKDFDTEKKIYIGKVLNHIHYNKLHTRIYEEFSNHMDDMYDDFSNTCNDEIEITKKVIDEMGSPDVLGDELKKVHSKTLRWVKIRRIAIIFIIIATLFGRDVINRRIVIGQIDGLPTETVNLEKSLITYKRITSHYSNFSEINKYTNIDSYDWHTSTPLFMVKEYNPLYNYYTLNENQSVIVDSDCFYRTYGTLYIDDTSKIPRNYHSDKLSKVVLFNYLNDLTITPDLSADEVLELEKLAIINDNDTKEELQIEKLILSNNNNTCCWMFQFHIKDLEGLYYTSDYNLYKSTNGKYYIGTYDYFSDKDACIYQEIPEYIGIKIDKAFENAEIKFEDSKKIIQY